MMYPSNSFKQEPLDSAGIEEFYRNKKGAKWWISEMIDVNGPNTHPVYQYLRWNSSLNAKQGSDKPQQVKEIPWNYAKFLVDANGNVISFYPPATKPT